MGWFGGRSDSVETVEGAQEVVSRVSSDLAKKKDTVKSLQCIGVAKATTPSTRVRPRRQKTVKALRAQRRESLVHEIVALKSYRDQLRATLAGIDAEIAAKNTRLAAHDAESRTGSEEYQRLKTPRAAKKPARSVSDGEK